ncbi:unnamed protein product [Caenorhabditis angaria]|uniref:Uncharacterized protein n=1 Tax=Caenorhabditis angaria TaxID=860376 RepID=A0A9P1N4H9_9PELO|nr:unnamed protein product [Caenorhabditis angaria]
MIFSIFLIILQFFPKFCNSQAITAGVMFLKAADNVFVEITERNEAHENYLKNNTRTGSQNQNLAGNGTENLSENSTDTSSSSSFGQFIEQGTEKIIDVYFSGFWAGLNKFRNETLSTFSSLPFVGGIVGKTVEILKPIRDFESGVVDEAARFFKSAVNFIF